MGKASGNTGKLGKAGKLGEAGKLDKADRMHTAHGWQYSGTGKWPAWVLETTAKAQEVSATLVTIDAPNR